MSEYKHPHALIVDDDSTHTKIMDLILDTLGISTHVVSTSRDFINIFGELKPELSFIDLNIERFGVGYTLIETIRERFGPSPNLIVVSCTSEQSAVTHAMDVGANDYIAKPVNRDILAMKASRFIQTEELLGLKKPFCEVPGGGAKAVLHLDFKVQEINETGIKILSRHLLYKGFVLPINGPFIHEVTGRAQALLTTVSSTWVEPAIGSDPSYYGATVEFDIADVALMDNIRQWLSTKNKARWAKHLAPIW